MGKASPCLCSHSGPTLQAILLQAVEKWTTGWNVSQSINRVNKICFCAWFRLSSNTILGKNVIFRWFSFLQLVQEQTLGEVGNLIVIWWPFVSEIFMSKILISDHPFCSYEKMSGMFFIGTQCTLLICMTWVTETWVKVPWTFREILGDFVWL